MDTILAGYAARFKMGSPGPYRKAILLEAEKFRQYYTAARGKEQRVSVGAWRHKWVQWLEKAAATGAPA